MDLVFDQGRCLGALPQAMEGPGELRLSNRVGMQRQHVQDYNMEYMAV